MSLEQTSKLESQQSVEQTPSAILNAASLADIRASNAASDLKSGTVPDLQLSGAESNLQYCAAKDDNPRTKEAAETKEQKQDKAIKECFGSEVFDHLKDWDWLIDHRKELEAGFKKAGELGQDKLWDIARRMSELSRVDDKSLIYLSKQDSSSHGNLIPKRYDVYLRRGSLRSDNLIGWVHH